ncbi:MAG: peptidoglycan-associated lipoprotein Pal [Gammaproteobacteria bacterium]|nr:peptidoglycan-associated lipoprotein Pal [Gammaproteobacteria bacterium]
MNQLSVAGKALTVIFAVIFMIGCASTETTDTTDAAAEAEARRAAEAQAAEQAAEQAATDRHAKAAQQTLQDAVAAAGYVVYFEFDSSTLQPAGREVLDAHLALAKTNTKSIRLDGHTDERGTREYNMALGERRAKAVADYLSVNGVASYRIEAVSYGEERPVAYGSGEANWSQNRRVEIK